MPINLTISADSVEEFDTLLARFARSGDTAVAAVAAATMPEVRAQTQPAPAAATETGIAGMSVADVKTAAATADRATLQRMLAEEQGGKKRTGAISAIEAALAAAPTQQPDGTPITPTPAPVEQPTPGGTDAPPAESIPPNQQAAVDPFAPATGDTAATGQADAATTQATSVSATPAATAGDTATTASASDAGGEVTIQNLKDAMAALLKAKSASTAMQVLEQASGCKSLTTGSPSVVEKAKDDPALLRKVLDALNAAAAA